MEFTAEQINEALSAETREIGEQLVPVRDISGHGTAVAGIVAGNGRAIRQKESFTEGADSGMVPASDLLIVKLGVPREESFPKTTELMRAMTYLVKKAVSIGRPISVNISFGNTYGSHDGTSLLERFLDNASEVGRCVVCVGAGMKGPPWDMCQVMRCRKR